MLFSDDSDAEGLAKQLQLLSLLGRRDRLLMRNPKQHVGMERFSLARPQREEAAQFGGNAFAQNIYHSYVFHLDGLIQLVAALDVPVTVCTCSAW